MQTGSHADRPGLVFVKLGGSLITDKDRPYTARDQVIARLARETRQVIDATPSSALLLGHGSGSFGHQAARPHGTRQGVHTQAEWIGYAQVAAAAARLNRIVTDTFLAAGVPVLSISPSASARCRNYVLTELNSGPIHGALAHGLVPLLYGDVALDDVHGGTIVSTEDIFVYLAEEFHPTRILLVGDALGVVGPRKSVVPRITPSTLPELNAALTGSASVDVTGGMADKVARMVALVQRHPATVVHIVPGGQPGTLTRLLQDPAVPIGTRIVAD
jgi:isopentenyl phosphate kinase